MSTVIMSNAANVTFIWIEPWMSNSSNVTLYSNSSISDVFVACTWTSHWYNDAHRTSWQRDIHYIRHNDRRHSVRRHSTTSPFFYDGLKTSFLLNCFDPVSNRGRCDGNRKMSLFVSTVRRRLPDWRTSERSSNLGGVHASDQATPSCG